MQAAQVCTNVLPDQHLTGDFARQSCSAVLTPPGLRGRLWIVLDRISKVMLILWFSKTATTSLPSTARLSWGVTSPAGSIALRDLDGCGRFGFACRLIFKEVLPLIKRRSCRLGHDKHQPLPQYSKVRAVLLEATLWAQDGLVYSLAYALECPASSFGEEVKMLHRETLSYKLGTLVNCVQPQRRADGAATLNRADNDEVRVQAPEHVLRPGVNWPHRTPR